MEITAQQVHLLNRTRAERERNMTTTTDYQKQGTDFLNKHNITMKTRFIKNALYFPDDKETRDIFRVNFSRPNKKFSIRFGQSLNESTYNGGNPPTAYDVLACLEKYPCDTFEDFCANYGYDVYSRKDFKVYQAVCKEWDKVKEFFTAEEIEEMQEIN